MFRLVKYYLIVGERGAAPKIQNTTLSIPRAFFTLLYTIDLAIDQPKGSGLLFSYAYVPSTPIDLAHFAIFCLIKPF